MQLSNLSIGLRVPNYKKLCELLGVPAKEGNSKNAQLKEFSRYFAYEREKNAYIITEIFDTPKESNDGRSKYIRLIEPVLLNYLARDMYHHGSNTWNRWFQKLGFSGSDLFDNTRCEAVLDAWQANSYSLHYFKNLARNKMRGILSSALSNMQTRNLIRYKEVWNIIDKSGFGHLARDGERARIEKSRQIILDELGYESYSSIVLSPSKNKKFNDRFHEWLVKNTLWRNAFKVVYIEPVGEAYTLYADTDVTPLKKALNKEVCHTVSSLCGHAWEKDLARGDFLWEIDDDEDFEKASEAFKEEFSLPNTFKWDTAFFIDQLMHL